MQHLEKQQVGRIWVWSGGRKGGGGDEVTWSCDWGCGGDYALVCSIMMAKKQKVRQFKTLTNLNTTFICVWDGST